MFFIRRQHGGQERAISTAPQGLVPYYRMQGRASKHRPCSEVHPSCAVPWHWVNHLVSQLLRLSFLTSQKVRNNLSHRVVLNALKCAVSPVSPQNERRGDKCFIWSLLWCKRETWHSPAPTVVGILQVVTVIKITYPCSLTALLWHNLDKYPSLYH